MRAYELNTGPFELIDELAEEVNENLARYGEQRIRPLGSAWAYRQQNKRTADGFEASPWEMAPDFELLDETVVQVALHAGEQLVDTSSWRANPLRAHGGTGANLLLRWNDVPADARSLDIVLHLHGYIALPPDPPMLRAVAMRSGLDLSGRQRPTLAILPRGRHITPNEVQQRQAYYNKLAQQTGKKPKTARSDAYTFPALWHNGGAGLEWLITGALQWFTQRRGGGAPLQISRLIFTAHSGGGAALDQLVALHASRRVCNPDEVHVFDAFYGDVDGVKSWVTARLARDRAMSPASPGGALRVIYRGDTQAGSCKVDTVLPRQGEPLRARYRVEGTEVDHNKIPTMFGRTLLSNCAAHLGLQSGCMTPSKNSNAPHANKAPGSSSPTIGASPANDSVVQQIADAFASGQWYLGLGLAVLTGERDENRLASMIFFARHPKREGRKLMKSEPDFKTLSQEWLDIRDKIVRPYLARAASGSTATVAPPRTVKLSGAAHPEVNTSLPPSGPGFIRGHKDATRSYGLPETIRALQEIAEAWHNADSKRPRILIRDISPLGGTPGGYEGHRSHGVGLDIDLRLEGGESIWYYKTGKKVNDRTQWRKNSKYSSSLTAELARLILSRPWGGLKVRSIYFDDPVIQNLFKGKVTFADKQQGATSPHRDHFHVRFCAPTYFAPKVDERYKSCT